MSDVTSTFGSLSSTNATNAPADATSIGSGLGANLRQIEAHVAAWRDGTAWGTIVLTSVAGTNTITATLASAGDITFGPTSYVTNSRFLLIPANTNTGATTLNITSPNGGSALGAKSIFWNGAALVGKELKAGVPALVVYDGTQFNLVSQSSTATSRLVSKTGSGVSGANDTNENTLATITIPANALGANGVIKFWFNFVTTDNADSKTFRVRYSGGSGTIIASYNVASVSGAVLVGTIINGSATNSQICNNFINFSNNSSSATINASSSVDTTSSSTLVVTVQKGTGTDSCTLTSYLVEIVSDGA